MQIKNILTALENWAPRSLQESYDNARLITGNQQWECTGALLTLDCIESVIDEAIEKGCNLIVAHHPIVFSGLMSLTGANYIERTIIKAIKSDIAIYAIHTNLDNVATGVNKRIADRIGLVNTQILAPKKGLLSKLLVMVPTEQLEVLQQALFNAGAGKIGNYSECSFASEGNGTFLAGEEANPHIGEKGQRHIEKEGKLEVVFPKHLQSTILTAMKAAHPYEEVAYDIIALENTWQEVGAGMIGELENAMEVGAFLDSLKEQMELNTFRHTKLCKPTIKKVAVAGGSGSFLLENAKRAQADIFITADYKYHQFFDADNDLIIADIGHYESEQYTKALIFEHLSSKFPNFALHLSNVHTNPVYYR